MLVNNIPEKKWVNYSTFLLKLLSHSHLLIFAVHTPWFSEKTVAKLFTAHCTFHRRSISRQKESEKERTHWHLSECTIPGQTQTQYKHTHTFSLLGFKSWCWNVLTAGFCLITELSTQYLSTVRLCVFLCFPSTELYSQYLSTVRLCVFLCFPSTELYSQYLSTVRLCVFLCFPSTELYSQYLSTVRLCVFLCFPSI